MDALTELKHIGFGGFSPHFNIPCTQPVGGFINIVLRGLLRLNYDEYI